MKWGRPISLGVILFTLVALSACKGYKHRYQNSYVEIEKTPCFGSCPVYTLRIEGNGNATMDVKRFRPQIGVFKQKFAAEEINKLFRYLSNLDWLSFEDTYETYYADLPGTVVVFKHQRTFKRIVIPGGAEIPKELEELIARLESYSDSGEWIGEIK